MALTMQDYAGMATNRPMFPELPTAGTEMSSPETMQAIARWCEAAFDEAKQDQGTSDELTQIDKYIDYLSGKQWPEGRPSYRSKPVNNRMWRLFSELAAILTDIRPIADVRSTSREKQYVSQEDILNKTMKAWWRNNRVESKVAMTIIYAILTTGFAKISWDNELHFGDGDICIEPISPRCILPLKAGTDLQSAQALIYQDVKPVGWVKAKYPKRAYMVYADQDVSQFSIDGGPPPQVSPQLYQMLTPAIRRTIGGKNRQIVASSYPMCRYREFWLKDYCIVPSTRVLTADLQWKRADQLKVGEELIGCDEEPFVSPDSRATKRKVQCRWIRRTRVESIKALRQPCVKITTDKGTVTSSTLHRWLVDNKTRFDWKRAGEMKPGDKIAFFCKPWEEENSKDAGYLSGIFDGEGWCTRYDLGFSQNGTGGNGLILHRAMALLEERNFTTRVDPSKKNDLSQVHVLGGREERMRFLGTMRPPRLLSQSAATWEGKLIQGRNVQPATVISIEEVGEQEVLGIQTSKRTFIAEGMISHNSVNSSQNTIRIGPAEGNDRYRIGYYVRPMERIYPRGRLIVMAGRNVVHDGPNPYWHGLFPFAMCRLNVVPWQLYGLSDLGSWKDLQDIVNQIFAGVLDMIKRAVNPPMFFPTNAIGESARAQIDLSMPGAKVAYSQVAAHEPRIQQVASLPGFVLQFLQGAEREMDQQSGIATVDEAMRKKQVPGGDTLDQIRNSKQTPIRMKARNIEDFIVDCGQQLVPNFFQFYDSDRTVFSLGSVGSVPQQVDWKPKEMMPESVNPAFHIRKFRFEIVEGSLLSIQRVEKVLALMRLRMSGDLDRKTFFQFLDKFENVYIDVDQVEQNLKQERAEGLMGMPPKGKKGTSAGGGAKQPSA